MHLRKAERVNGRTVKAEVLEELSKLYLGEHPIRKAATYPKAEQAATQILELIEKALPKGMVEDELAIKISLALKRPKDMKEDQTARDCINLAKGFNTALDQVKSLLRGDI